MIHQYDCESQINSFFLPTLEKITLFNNGEYFFFKNLTILQFLYEVYMRNSKLIWSLLVIRFSKTLYKNQKLIERNVKIAAVSVIFCFAKLGPKYDSCFRLN